MKETVLTIVVPIRLAVTNSTTISNVPYGPAVVNGILNDNGYNGYVWDLNIDMYYQFKDQWPDLVDLLGIRAYRDPENKLSLDWLKWVRSALAKKITEINPDIILLSVFSSQSLDFAIPLSTFIKDIAPNCYTIIGGRGIDNVERNSKKTYAELFSNYLPVDCVYVGDAENNLINIIEQRYQGLFHSPPVTGEEIENVPNASWQGYDLSKYAMPGQVVRLPITGSKGCVRDCTFCDVAGSWPKYVYRKGESLAGEIISAYQESKITKFEFTDNLVNGSISNFRQMNTILASEIPNTIGYCGYAIVRPSDQNTKEDFRLAGKAGAELLKLGIESGSEKVRHDIRKKFSNKDITWFSENCVDNGIKQLWLMFVGYPTETEDDFQQTLDLLKDHSYLTKSGLLKVYLSLPMQLTSGSAFMRKFANEYGLEHNRYDSWSDFFWTSNKYRDNTFDVRLNRWRRMVDAIHKYGYADDNVRQAEKMLEIDGIEKIWKDREKKSIFIPITAINSN